MFDDNQSRKSRSDYGYDYNRPNVDNRFKQLSAREIDENFEADDTQHAMPLARAISNYDKKFLEYLVNMHNATHGDRIDIDQFASAVDGLEHMKKEQEYEYLNTLTKPETTKGSKIPSQIPVPSSSFQLHNSVIISPNASGHASLIFNPFYLASSGTQSTFFVNNNSTLNGTSSNNNFVATNIGQVIPAVYNQYRVVSASVVVKYVGRLDIVQGVIGGAIIFDQNISPADYSTNATNLALAKYGDFNLAMDAFYTQENLTLNGIRELYFPLDTTYEQYQNISTGKTGFGFLVYIFGGVPSSAAYKIDIFVNYECLPDSAFLNYLPTTMCTGGNDRKEDAIKQVQQRPITDENETRPQYKRNGFWDSLKQSLGNVLPAIPLIAGTLFPQFKGISNILTAGMQLAKQKRDNY